MEYLTRTPRHVPSKSHMISLNVLGNYEINNVLIVGPTTTLHYFRIFVGTQQLISFFDSAEIRLDECLSLTWFYFSTYHFTIVGFPKHLAPSIYIIISATFGVEYLTEIIWYTKNGTWNEIRERKACRVQIS